MEIEFRSKMKKLLRSRFHGIGTRRAKMGTELLDSLCYGVGPCSISYVKMRELDSPPLSLHAGEMAFLWRVFSTPMLNRTFIDL